MITKFPPSVITALDYYVYVYSHPVTKEVFYVGKGRGNRAFDHLKDTKESHKTRYISNLKEEGLDPLIEILIHGINEETALRVEATFIDLLGRDNLTNMQHGHKSSTHGRLNVRQIISMYERTQVEITDSVIAFKVNQLFYPSISATELYDITRSQWKVNKANAEKAKYAFAVYEFIIQEVYEISAWFEGGSTYNSRGTQDAISGRYEFIGRIAPDDIRNKYQYKSIDHYYKRGEAQSFKYFNIAI